MTLKVIVVVFVLSKLVFLVLTFLVVGVVHMVLGKGFSVG